MRDTKTLASLSHAEEMETRREVIIDGIFISEAHTISAARPRFYLSFRLLSIRPLSSDDMIRSEIKSSFILGDTEGRFCLFICFAEQQITCRELMFLWCLWLGWLFSDGAWISQFSHSVVSDSLWPHESQHARPPCPSPTPGVYSNSYPSSGWCHLAISSSVVSFSSCPQSLPASESFPMTQLFAWGGQSMGVSASASVLPMNT